MLRASEGRWTLEIMSGVLVPIPFDMVNGGRNNLLALVTTNNEYNGPFVPLKLLGEPVRPRRPLPEPQHLLPPV